MLSVSRRQATPDSFAPRHAQPRARRLRMISVAAKVFPLFMHAPATMTSGAQFSGKVSRRGERPVRDVSHVRILFVDAAQDLDLDRIA